MDGWIDVLMDGWMDGWMIIEYCSQSIHHLRPFFWLYLPRVFSGDAKKEEVRALSRPFRHHTKIKSYLHLQIQLTMTDIAHTVHSITALTR